MSGDGARRDGLTLISRPFLALIGVVFIGVALSLHPDALGFRTWVSITEADAVSLAYLELELRRTPEDVALRTAYVHQLRGVGRLDEAYEAARTLELQDRLDEETYDLLVELATSRLRAAPTIEDWAPRAERLAALLARAIVDSALVDRRPALAERAVEIGRMDLAAELIAGATQLPLDERLERGARYLEAGGDPASAGDRWLVLAETELEGEGRTDVLERALDGLLRADRAGDALELVYAWLRRAPRSGSALDYAVQLERGLGQLDRAFAVSRRRVEVRPDDPEVHRVHVELALERGRPKEGLASVRRWTALRPGARAPQVRRARIAEWTGSLEEALSVWRGLARSGDREGQREAERLARALGREDVLLKLLARRLRRRPTSKGIRELLFLAEKAGRPQVARQVLLQAIERPKVAREVWIALVRLEARMGQLPAAVGRWQDIQRRFGLHPYEAEEAAALAWRAGGLEAAWGPLEDVPPEKLSREGLELLSNLSWLSGRRGPAVVALRLLVARGAATSLHYLRLAQLLDAGERGDEALAAAEQGLEEAPSKDLFIFAFTLAVQRQLPERALAMKARFPRVWARAEGLPGFWRARAELARLQRDPEAARNALERVVSLDGGSARSMADLLWLLLDLSDPGLGEWYLKAAEGADRRPSLWPPLAASASRLSRHREAIRWYALEAEREPEGWGFWLDYAEALERVGRRDAALRLRRYALAQVPKDDALGLLVAGASVEDDAGRAARARRLLVDGTPRERRWAARILLDVGEVERARREVGGALTTNLPAAELAVALALRDRAAVTALIPVASGRAPAALIAEAHAFLGDFDTALAVALASRVDGSGPVARTTVARYLEAETRDHPRQARLDGVFIRLAGLDGLGVDARAEYAFDDLGFEVTGGWLRLTDRPGRDAGIERTDAARAMLLARLRWGDAGLRIGFGVDARDRGPAIPQANLQVSGRLDPRLDGWFRVGVGDVVAETPLMYTLAARDRASAGVAWRPRPGWRATVELEGEHHRDRAGTTLGGGLTAEVLGARSWRVFADHRFEVYGSARASWRELESTLGPELSALAATGRGPEDVLPARFGNVGVGVRWSRGDLSQVPTPLRALRYRVDGWIGWQWPRDGLAYQVEAAIGHRILGPDELSVGAVVGNVVGGLDEAQAEVRVGYRLRFDP
ncbi:MAG: tetratricopeptide repeat protein [Myxococcota bacterium]